MIDVQPYLDKLDRLKEYMDAWIDGGGSGIWINIDALSKDFTVEEIIDIWECTGWLICNREIDETYKPPRKLSFEEWLQLNTNNDLKLKQ